VKEKYAQHANRTKFRNESNRKKQFLTKIFFSIEIVLDEKSATNIEIAEDGHGDDVYFNYVKVGRNSMDEADLDEERMYENN
jgi:hypothetical protein